MFLVALQRNGHVVYEDMYVYVRGNEKGIHVWTGVQGDISPPSLGP